MELWVIWLILAGLLIVVEMLTLTFYLLWLGIGAAAAAVIDFIWPGALVLEIAVCCVVVLILTLFTKPLTRRFHSARGFKDAVDEMVGKQGVVLESIAANAPGIVKVGNETWSAVSDGSIETGETVIVVSRGSAVLQVRKKGG
ncbi:NfeD family protein [Paenibacillus harenae]|uniref:NfeD family protein n=1 Tax=Paenibacillus harenae TaxID=306543 RepID=UPI0004002156|nr:NfeD family protein [Paenibacillus harenae]